MKSASRRRTTAAVAFFVMWCTSTLRLLAALGEHGHGGAELWVTALGVLVGAWVVADRIAWGLK
jgi:hypothetical protein